MSLDHYASALRDADRRARPRGTPKAKRAPRPRHGFAPPQPERNRLILALWSLDRSSYADIAAEAKCSRSAVAGVIDRARRAGRLPDRVDA